MNSEGFGDIEIREMNIAEQMEFDKFLDSKPDNKDIAFHVILKCCINEDGSKMFNEDDVEFLKQKSSASVLRLFNEILDINNQKSTSLEELEKN